MRKNALIILILVFAFLPVFAQRERNYIYLFDCTSSMLDGVQPKNLTPELFKSKTTLYYKTKQFLKEDIERNTDPNTTITIVPFHQKPGNAIRFERKNFKWSKVEEALDEMVKQSQNTGVCNAWKVGVKYLDDGKDNYFFLMTDGTENVDPRRGAAVVDLVRQWCNTTSDHSYGFYVALTEEAYVNCPGLEDAVNDCQRMSLVKDHQGPFGSFGTNQVSINTRNLKPKAISFSAEGVFDVQGIDCADPYFDVRVRNNKIQDGQMILEFAVKQRPDVDQYAFDITVNTDLQKLQITNPVIHVNVSNLDVRTLDMTAEQIDGGRSTYHPAFMFSKAKTPDTLKVDLGAEWNDAAINDNSEARFLVECPELKNHYTLIYNGQDVKNGAVTVKASDEASELWIVLDSEVSQGKYYFTLTKTGDASLELLNDDSSRQYDNEIRVKQIVRWNPLARGLFWLAVGLIALLLLWLLVIKAMVFPTFKVGAYRITEPYYTQKKLRGVRKVVVGNKSGRQSWISKIMTGKILYETNAYWAQPWSMTPSAKRTGARMQGLGNNYMIDPFCTTMQKQTEYEITKQEGGDKCKIELL